MTELAGPSSPLGPMVFASANMLRKALAPGRDRRLGAHVGRAVGQVATRRSTPQRRSCALLLIIAGRVRVDVEQFARAGVDARRRTLTSAGLDGAPRHEAPAAATPAHLILPSLPAERPGGSPRRCLRDRADDRKHAERAASDRRPEKRPTPIAAPYYRPMFGWVNAKLRDLLRRLGEWP